MADNTIKIKLNPNNPYSYSFYCPISKINLTKKDPYAYISIDDITPNIRKALENDTLKIELDDKTTIDKPSVTEENKETFTNNNKENLKTYYTKNEIDQLLEKVILETKDDSEFYTKEEINKLLSKIFVDESGVTINDLSEPLTDSQLNSLLSLIPD